jgi:DNA-binding transcriptional MerR regulator
MSDEQPSKLYYTISEVADLTGVKAHVLRYWESEFPTLRPRKTRSGSRRYRQKDIDEIQAIKRLLYEEGYRIAGARKMLRQAQQTAREAAGPARPQLKIPFQEMAPSEQLLHVREELEDVIRLVRELKDGASAGTTTGEPKPREAEGKA